MVCADGEVANSLDTNCIACPYGTKVCA
jgi:hypothetical protein